MPARPVPPPEELAIAHADAELPVTFVRSPRARRVSLRVDSARRRVVLTAPLRMSREAEQLLLSAELRAGELHL
jgi:predicted metal-dependent hydrolase